MVLDAERFDMSKTALLVIDVQKGFDELAYWGKRNNPEAEENMARLIVAWREGKQPLIHIKHNSTQSNSPLRPELPGNAFKDLVQFPHKQLSIDQGKLLGDSV